MRLLILSMVLGVVVAARDAGPVHAADARLAGNAPGALDAKADGDAKAIQGKWTVATSRVHGEENANAVGDTMTFAAEKVVLKKRDADQSKEGTFTIDPAAKPKQIAITPAGQPASMLGIYELDGDTLKICMASTPGGPRPEKFESTPAQKVVLMTLTRGK